MIDNIEEYLQNQLAELKKKSNTQVVENSITGLMNTLLSKRYRKSRINKVQRDHIRKYISNCLTSKDDIDIYLMTGGYKQPRLPSAPHIGWAEVFNILYMLKFGSELASHCSNTVNITYRTHGAIVNIINDVPKSYVDIYQKEFSSFLNYALSLQSNPNLTMKIEEAYSYEAAKLLVDQLSIDNSTTVNVEKISKAKRNFLNRDIDDKIAIKSYLLNKEFLGVDPFISKSFHDDKICIFFRGVGPSDRLSYGSTKSSDVQFWSGIGVLNATKSGDTYMDIKGKSAIEFGGYNTKKVNLYSEYPGLKKIYVRKKLND